MQSCNHPLANSGDGKCEHERAKAQGSHEQEYGYIQKREANTSSARGLNTESQALSRHSTLWIYPLPSILCYICGILHYITWMDGLAYKVLSTPHFLFPHCHVYHFPNRKHNFLPKKACIFILLEREGEMFPKLPSQTKKAIAITLLGLTILWLFTLKTKGVMLNPGACTDAWCGDWVFPFLFPSTPPCYLSVFLI